MIPPGRSLKDVILGHPLPTQLEKSQRLDTLRALATLSPDALSSIAYANQEIYLGLASAGAAALVYSVPIAGVIVLLLIILTLSYSQTISAYPRGGGSYTVARENIGTNAGLIAASALLVDYILVAAVSLTAGVAELVSAFPVLASWRVELALLFLIIITWINLRGLQETGSLISIPVYLFIISMLMMLTYAGIRFFNGSLLPAASTFKPEHSAAAVGIGLLLHTFASGCTALTGIEAISNGIGIFKPPEVKHARQAMVGVATLMTILFLGTIAVGQLLGITPVPGETVLSALSRQILGDGFFYILVQVSLLAILIVAANTSFAGFPRVASILARDGFLPHQFANLGDRLVYSNGLLFLSGIAAVLIVAFHGDSHSLIPLFAVGVFLAFTLSQAGMIVHWYHDRNSGWWLKAAVNGTGAIMTAAAFVIIAVSKFLDGAWIVGLLIPLTALSFRRVHRHYETLDQELAVFEQPAAPAPMSTPRVVLPIAGVHRGVQTALQYALSISCQVTAVYVEIDPEQTEKVLQLWQRWGSGVPLEVVPSPYRSLVGPFLAFLDQFDESHDDGQLATVILPEVIPARWWENLLHNQAAWMLKLALLYRRRRYGKVRAIIDMPVYLQGSGHKHKL
ncbi:MAG: APC family permease [Anaerolineales bacterium]|nr:APC family permease [Anaerolineales bacterium]